MLWFRLPGVCYLAPAAAFVGAATLALVAMSDYGAVIILGMLFIVMLYTGFESRTFLTIAALGLGLSLVVGLVLSQVWNIPASIQYRYLAFKPLVEPDDGQRLYDIRRSRVPNPTGGLCGHCGRGNRRRVGHGFSIFYTARPFGFYPGRIDGRNGICGRDCDYFPVCFSGASNYPGGNFITLFAGIRAAACDRHRGTFVYPGFYHGRGYVEFFPFTGVTLPFLSLGGVAVLVKIFEIGLILTLVQRIDPIFKQGN